MATHHDPADIANLPPPAAGSARGQPARLLGQAKLMAGIMMQREPWQQSMPDSTVERPEALRAAFVRSEVVDGLIPSLQVWSHFTKIHEELSCHENLG
jgi:hypothetical protein